MDLQHFGIMVQSMLSWSDEPHERKRTPGRAGAAESKPDDSDGEDEPDVDDESEPSEDLHLGPDAIASSSGAPGEPHYAALKAAQPHD